MSTTYKTSGTIRPKGAARPPAPSTSFALPEPLLRRRLCAEQKGSLIQGLAPASIALASSLPRKTSPRAPPAAFRIGLSSALAGAVTLAVSRAAFPLRAPLQLPVAILLLQQQVRGEGRAKAKALRNQRADIVEVAMHLAQEIEDEIISDLQKEPFQRARPLAVDQRVDFQLQGLEGLKIALGLAFVAQEEVQLPEAQALDGDETEGQHGGLLPSCTPPRGGTATTLPASPRFRIIFDEVSRGLPAPLPICVGRFHLLPSDCCQGGRQGVGDPSWGWIQPQRELGSDLAAPVHGHPFLGPVGRHLLEEAPHPIPDGRGRGDVRPSPHVLVRGGRERAPHLLLVVDLRLALLALRAACYVKEVHELRQCRPIQSNGQRCHVDLHVPQDEGSPFRRVRGVVRRAPLRARIQRAVEADHGRSFDVRIHAPCDIRRWNQGQQSRRQGTEEEKRLGCALKAAVRLLRGAFHPRVVRGRQIDDVQLEGPSLILESHEASADATDLDANHGDLVEIAEQEEVDAPEVPAEMHGWVNLRSHRDAFDRVPQRARALHRPALPTHVLGAQITRPAPQQLGSLDRGGSLEVDHLLEDLVHAGAMRPSRLPGALAGDGELAVAQDPRDLPDPPSNGLQPVPSLPKAGGGACSEVLGIQRQVGVARVTTVRIDQVLAIIGEVVALRVRGGAGNAAIMEVELKTQSEVKVHLGLDRHARVRHHGAEDAEHDSELVAVSSAHHGGQGNANVLVGNGAVPNEDVDRNRHRGHDYLQNPQSVWLAIAPPVEAERSQAAPPRRRGLVGDFLVGKYHVVGARQRPHVLVQQGLPFLLAGSAPDGRKRVEIPRVSRLWFRVRVREAVLPRERGWAHPLVYGIGSGEGRLGNPKDARGHVHVRRRAEHPYGIEVQCDLLEVEGKRSLGEHLQERAKPGGLPLPKLLQRVKGEPRIFRKLQREHRVTDLRLDVRRRALPRQGSGGVGGGDAHPPLDAHVLHAHDDAAFRATIQQLKLGSTALDEEKVLEDLVRNAGVGVESERRFQSVHFVALVPAPRAGSDEVFVNASEAALMHHALLGGWSSVLSLDRLQEQGSQVGGGETPLPCRLGRLEVRTSPRRRGRPASPRTLQFLGCLE
eukprot:scaffold869_cov303-Pinguiococcus_pyrenoidosus.AAC.7